MSNLVSKPKKIVINIWSLMSFLFILYGLLILGAGFFYLNEKHPPLSTQLHPSIWWGAVILIAGILFLIFSSRGQKPEKDISKTD